MLKKPYLVDFEINTVKQVFIRIIFARTNLIKKCKEYMKKGRESKVHSIRQSIFMISNKERHSIINKYERSQNEL